MTGGRKEATNNPPAIRISKVTIWLVAKRKPPTTLLLYELVKLPYDRDRKEATNNPPDNR